MTVTGAGRKSPGASLSLPGLDGTNPLGFLAALGVLRIATQAERAAAVLLDWVPIAGTWRARLHGFDDQDSVLDLLERHLVRNLDQHPLGRMLAIDDQEPRQRHQEMRLRAVGATYRDSHLEWVSAMASDAVPTQASNQLQVVRRDYFQGNLRSIMQRTEREHLVRSLFREWDYADALENQSLHFDPSEDRRHAHQWNQPNGDPDRKSSGGMLGANRLAIEALPIFVSLPERDRLHTLGFSGFRADSTRWTWPLWDCPINLDVARSVLALTDIQDELPSREAIQRLRARGVIAVLRTHRILVGKTPNFTPTRVVA